METYLGGTLKIKRNLGSETKISMDFLRITDVRVQEVNSSKYKIEFALNGEDVMLTLNNAIKEFDFVQSVTFIRNNDVFFQLGGE